ncbi:FAD-dependent oxidoreductase [Plantactinospora sp. WMMB334]|uniref:FAD-dependent oxidoreductase n=1 Tax=Plantactinospora sp. WMMB334 TaxID=3404119 RepID=UPI003B95F7B9
MDSRKHAVVIGASMAGLLAARALYETYERVTILERDRLPEDPTARRGVPQGRQLHVLLTLGAEILGELFPGVEGDLIAAGALRLDPQQDTTYVLDGQAIAAGPSGLTVLGVSRPTVEHHVRRRVSELPGITIRSGVQVTGLLIGAAGATAVGVRTSDGDTPGLEADLVVDATGRSSRAPAWLRESGFPVPATDRVEVDVTYVTRTYRWAQGQLDGRHGMLIVPMPGNPRGGAAMRVEGDRWTVALFGLAGNAPPVDERPLLAFADALPVPDLARLLREAEPLDDPVPMPYRASVRHRFERCPRHLDGFVVVGDALCSFNPTYGQGMSVAAMEALILRDLTRAETAGLPARFYRAARSVVDDAWTLSVGGDMRFPEIPGRRTVADRILNGYLNRYRRAATVNAGLATTFLRVAQMKAPATEMLSPRNAVRVMRGSRRAGRPPAVQLPTGHGDTYPGPPA